MAYTNIKKSSDYFNTKLYTGNGGTQSITGVDFQPDLTWIKDRTVGFDHVLQDLVRGTTKIINSNQNYAEFTNADSITSFNSDGFTTGSYVATNQNTTPYVAWNWKANGAGVANTDGSISSTVSANTTSGFSILTRTGTGSNGTIGHGLGVAPKVIINKDLSSTAWWGVYHESLGNTNAIYLNTTNATDASVQYWNNTSPTSTVFSVGTNSISNASGKNYVSYCFAEKQGFSKFGSYTGNGSTDGTFVYTGFKPAFVINKIYSGTTSNWNIFDNKRDGFNDQNKQLYADLANTEASGGKIDLLSNGFKLRSSSSEVNGSGYGYIYMAFAEQPLVGDNPATAR